MGLTVKIEPFAQDINIIVNEMLGPQARSEAIAEFAQQAIDEADRKNAAALGRKVNKTVSVDGAKNAPLATVRPDGGTIVAEWDLFIGIIPEIYQMLVSRSPRQSGDYIAGHKLFADGAEIAISDNLPPANEYAFVNTVPYARKIEIGKTEAGRDFVIQVQNQIYQRTASDVRSRFGNLATITFSYRDVSAGSRAPAIIIRPKG